MFRSTFPTITPLCASLMFCPVSTVPGLRPHALCGRRRNETSLGGVLVLPREDDCWLKSCYVGFDHEKL